jgi:hypothetical protein
MNKMKKLEKLKIMFNKCGNEGLMVSCMDNEGNRWRISRSWNLGSRINWVKCKKVLEKSKIEFIEGESGWGVYLSRCIDFNY